MIDSTLNQFELHFQSLFDSGRAYAFPYDPKGMVDLDQLSDRARNNYLYARAVVGHELAFPAVRASGLHTRPGEASRPAPAIRSCALPSGFRSSTRRRLDVSDRSPAGARPRPTCRFAVRDAPGG